MEKGVNMEEKFRVSQKEILDSIVSPYSKRGAKGLNPLVLAYIGDAIYEVFVRKYLIVTQVALVNQLHKSATKFVRAEAQSFIIHEIMEELTEEEWTIVKRGRNHKSATVPKNANISDYRYATGFEALIGYLYLIDNQDRLMEILSRSVEFIQNRLNEHNK